VKSSMMGALFSVRRGPAGLADVAAGSFSRWWAPCECARAGGSDGRRSNHPSGRRRDGDWLQGHVVGGRAIPNPGRYGEAALVRGALA
jgi:hypothetical protein